MYKIFSIKTLFFLMLLIGFTNSCGIYKYSDARKNPTNADQRIKKNMESGKGFRFGSVGNKGSGEFMFASSNPLWRASIDKLSFAPLSNVDYAGGIIVTDWFSDGSSNEQLKITIRFLSNELRSDALNVIIHKKVCDESLNKCKVSTIENNLNQEVRLAILKKAAQLEQSDLKQTKKKMGTYRIPENRPKKKIKKKKK